MEKIKAFFDSTGAFFLWCWKYPSTPIENFQDAKFRYMAQTDPKLKKYFEDLIKEVKKLK